MVKDIELRGLPVTRQDSIHLLLKQLLDYSRYSNYAIESLNQYREAKWSLKGLGRMFTQEIVSAILNVANH
jgi:hypothetical protein